MARSVIGVSLALLCVACSVPNGVPGGSSPPHGAGPPSSLRGRESVARFYHRDLRFPTDTERAAARSGARVVITFKADPGRIIDGAHDEKLRRAAAAMSRAGGEWLVGYWHEPEDDMTLLIVRAKEPCVEEQ